MLILFKIRNGYVASCLTPQETQNIICHVLCCSQNHQRQPTFAIHDNHLQLEFVSMSASFQASVHLIHVGGLGNLLHCRTTACTRCSSRHATRHATRHTTRPASLGKGSHDLLHQVHDIRVILVLSNVPGIAHDVLHRCSHLWIRECLHELGIAHDSTEHTGIKASWHSHATRHSWKAAHTTHTWKASREASWEATITVAS
mmetsp:Transcript_42077/g.85767  ORF Transcript_42077/g.85767 Transcript_42077/m.85767 type:complete len:201 (-) Transcript_42077:877-1479(-)